MATKKTSQPQTTAQQLGSIIKSARDIMRKDKGLNGDGDRLPMLTWMMFLKFLDDHEQVREAESLDLLIALNSGIPGMCTIHANSASEAVEKLATLPLLAGENISRSFVAPTVGRNISLVLHCRMHRNGERKLEQIASLSWLERQRRFELKPIFEFQPRMDEQ